MIEEHHNVWQSVCSEYVCLLFHHFISASILVDVNQTVLRRDSLFFCKLWLQLTGFSRHNITCSFERDPSRGFNSF